METESPTAWLEGLRIEGGHVYRGTEDCGQIVGWEYQGGREDVPPPAGMREDVITLIVRSPEVSGR